MSFRLNKYGNVTTPDSKYSLMRRLKILSSAVRSLFAPPKGRPPSSTVLSSMLRQSSYPHWSGACSRVPASCSRVWC